MSSLKRLFIMLLIGFIGISIVPFSTAEAANYVSASKTVQPTSVLVGGEAEVTLNLKGTPPVNVVKPNDVILIIDRSGSMSPPYNKDGEDKMASAKAAAKGFIDLMDLTKHQVGIVDYSDRAFEGVPLTTDAAAAKSYIDKITANGGTGTGAAIAKAQELLANHRPEAQPVIVLMTDGDATIAGDGLSAYEYTLKKANEAKDAGIVFYTIALLGKSDNPDSSGPNKLLKDMATTSHHHHFVLGSTGLAQIYAAIVEEIGLASAYDVVVNDIVSDNFEIIPGSYDNNIPKPMVNGNTLTWNFLELKKDTLSFTYKIRQKQGGVAGTYPVTTTASVVTYKDYTGATRTYKIPSANLEVKNPAPIITTVSPNKGLIAGGETVTITGENFLPGAKIYFLNLLGTNVNVVSDKEVTVVTPAGTQGPVQVKLVNPDNQSATAEYSYYAIPEITSISPENGPIAGGTNVKVYGKNFMKGVQVKFGDKAASSITFNNSGYLYVKTPAVDTWGPVDVSIENPDGTSAVLEKAFNYDEPPKLELLSITPAEGSTIGNETVALAGKEFKTGAKVYFNNIESSSVTFSSAQALIVKTPVWDKEEKVDIKVVNPSGEEASLKQAYTYIAPPPPPGPTISSVTPNTGRMDENTLIYIDGANFEKGAKLNFGGADTTYSYVSATRLQLRTPFWNEPVSVDIQLTNPDGQSASLEKAFTYTAPPALPDPVVSRVSPANGPMTGGTLVYVDGANYQKGAKLFWIQGSNITEFNPDFINATRLRLRTPATTTFGPVDIRVVNPDNKEANLTAGFTYDAPPVLPDPVITSISPAVGNVKGGNVVEIYGEEFQKDAKVSFGSQEIDLYAYVSKARVRVKAPASDVAGTVSIKLTNPDGKSVTLPNAYTYEEAKPEITSVSPGNGPLAGGTMVYVDGNYLESGLTLTFAGAPISYDYVSNTRIRFRTPVGSAAGPVDIVITNPTGASVTAQFVYDAPPAIPAPTLTSLSPTSGPVAGGTLLYVDGKNFINGAVVNIDGVNYTASFINATRVRLRTPANPAAGVVPIKVINPDGQETGTLMFEYK